MKDYKQAIQQAQKEVEMEKHVEEIITGSRKTTDKSLWSLDLHDQAMVQGAIVLVWSWEDVLYRAAERGIKLTRAQCEDVIFNVGRRHDAEYGVSWLTLDCWIDDI